MRQVLAGGYHICVAAGHLDARGHRLVWHKDELALRSIQDAQLSLPGNGRYVTYLTYTCAASYARAVRVWS